MTRFQIERAIAFDRLTQKWQKEDPYGYGYSETELLKRAEFVARMKLAKQHKKETAKNQQRLF